MIPVTRGRTRLRGVRCTNGWRQLYGDFDENGLSIEWHDFRTASAFDWGRSFHPRSIEFCLNLDGRGAVGADGGNAQRLCAGNFRLLRDRGRAVGRDARAHDHHQFVTLEFSREHLQKQLVQNRSRSRTGDAAVIFGDKDENVVAPAADVDRTAQCGRDAGRTAGGESRADSLVSEQSARVDGAFSFRTEGSGIFLHATKKGGARPGGTDEGIVRARSGQPADAGDARARKSVAVRFI